MIGLIAAVLFGLTIFNEYHEDQERKDKEVKDPASEYLNKLFNDHVSIISGDYGDIIYLRWDEPEFNDDMISRIQDSFANTNWEVRVIYDWQRN